MKRYLCWLTLLGMLTIPDWASACYVVQWCAPPPCEVMPVYCYEPPVCYGPPVVYVPVYVAPCGPAVMPQTVIERDPPQVSQPRAKPNPVVERDRPEKATAPVEPTPIITREPEPKRVAEPMPMPMVTREPDPEPKLVVTPPVLPMPPKMEPDAVKPFEEPLVLPGGGKEATPTPAPAPDSTSLIPPMFPVMPEKLPKAPASNSDSLPPLVLPPEANNTIAKSSPLSARPRVRVQVLAAEGRPAVGPTRPVSFFNRTEHDLDLVIEGRTVKLPKQTYIHAKLAPTFRWKAAGGEAQTERIPEGAAGLDVVFRE